MYKPIIGRVAEQSYFALVCYLKENSNARWPNSNAFLRYAFGVSIYDSRYCFEFYFLFLYDYRIAFHPAQ